MKQRKLGSQGLTVSELGLGCMGMSEFYGTPDENEAITTIHRALEIGVTFLDTADMYGVGDNEELVGKAIQDRREQVILATKFGNVRGNDGSFLEENITAAEIVLSQAELEQIAKILPPRIAVGDRYSDISTVNR